MIPHRVRRARKGEQRIRPARLRFARHLQAGRARHDGAERQRRAPGGEHHAALLRREVQAASRVRPHRDARHLVLRHPGRIGLQRVLGQLTTAKGNRHRWNETPFESMPQLGWQYAHVASPFSRLPDSIAARS